MAVDATDRSDEEKRNELIERIRFLAGVLVYVPRMWLLALLAAAALSTLTIKREGDDWSVAFEVSTATIAILALIWLPTLLRIFMAVGTGVKAFGVEVSGGGIASLMDRFEPSGTFLHPPAQGEVEVPELRVHGAAPEYLEPPPRAPRPDWTFERDRIDRNQHELFLAHRIKPSQHPNQKYDVSIYLVGDKQIAWRASLQRSLPDRARGLCVCSSEPSSRGRSRLHGRSRPVPRSPTPSPPANLASAAHAGGLHGLVWSGTVDR